MNVDLCVCVGGKGAGWTSKFIDKFENNYFVSDLTKCSEANTLD